MLGLGVLSKICKKKLVVISFFICIFIRVINDVCGFGFFKFFIILVYILVLIYCDVILYFFVCVINFVMGNIFFFY